MDFRERPGRSKVFRDIEVQFEPLETWPGEHTAERRKSQFHTGFVVTMRQLERELTALECERVVIQIDADRSQIRRDGLLRADARARPAVIVSFDSKFGPVSYPCDTFDDWSDNLRAITLALESLRKIDRYGVSNRGQQYRGWQALPAPTRPCFKTKEEAIGFLKKILGVGIYIGTHENIERAIRAAESQTHPDHGGNPDDFKRVQAARELLLA